MQIKAEQLAANLRQQLLSVYFVSGDEPLLVQEACDQIRTAARAQGCSEREVYSVEPGFDWNGFLQAGDAMSLFADRKLLELRIPSGKPGDQGSKAIQAYCERPSPDNVLLIQAGKIDAAARKGKWHKALEGAGAVVQVWPIEVRQLPGWAMRRMKDKGLHASQEAVALLVERVEGNLLACVQEIEKLLLLYGPGEITLEQVASSVADSSRFDIFTLVDAALQGDSVRSSRIVQGLRAEGVEPILVLWALTREIRSMANMAADARNGGVEKALAKARVWDKRKPLVRAGLKRHSPRQWQSLLRRCAQIDGMVKGAQAGNVWDELLELSLLLGGVQLHPGLVR